MITRQNIISIPISPADMALLRPLALTATMAGVSHVHSQRSDRVERAALDNLIGQIGTFAGHLWLYGTPERYFLDRWQQNKTPHAGDGGQDVEGCNIDFKASLWRDYPRPLSKYRLLVRPAERHPDWIYVHMMVAPITDERTTVYITGWATDDMLPTDVLAAPDKCAGAFALTVPQLNPMIPLRWIKAAA